MLGEESKEKEIILFLIGVDRVDWVERVMIGRCVIFLVARNIIII